MYACLRHSYKTMTRTLQANPPCAGLYTVSVRNLGLSMYAGDSTMSNVVRLGVIGAGAIAQRGILPHLSQTDVADRVIYLPLR